MIGGEHNFTLWLAVGFALLMTLGASTLVLLQARRQHAAVQARLAGVVSGHGPARADTRRRTVTARPRREKSDLGVRVLAIIGYDPSRKAQYPMPWAVVALLAMILSRLVAYLEGFLLGDVALLTMPVLTWWFARAYWRFYDNRRRKALYEQFPDALGSIVRSVRVGIPVQEALRNVARDAPEPTGAEFRLMSDQVWIGAALETALISVANRSGVTEYRFFATAISLQAQTGGGLSETLETLADVIRQRIALRKRGYALAAEARTSATLLACLPFVTAGALALLSPEYIVVLFTDDTGKMVLAAALVMLGIGVSVMKFMIKKSLT